MRSLLRAEERGKQVAHRRELLARANDRPGQRHLRIAGGHVARVCGYQGRTEATLQQRLTPLSARLSHGVPPHVPIGVRPVDGAAR
jgi:hypothetical protein